LRKPWRNPDLSRNRKPVLAYRADRDLSAPQKAIVAFRDALVATNAMNDCNDDPHPDCERSPVILAQYSFLTWV